MYHHFTRDRRVALAALLRAGYSQNKAAEEIGMDQSAVSRELRRNPLPDGSYHATHADVVARARRKHAKQHYRKIECDAALAERIERKLHPLISPEVVAHDESVSHTTIYAWIERSRHDLRSRLPQRGRKRRRYGSKRAVKQGWTREVHSIDERPVSAESRSRLGHFEGDTMRGKHGAILPHVERKSRFTIAALVPNEEADTAYQHTKHLKPYAPRSITYDRGSSFALWRMVEQALHTRVFFAHARHPWERGTCENTIGRLRRMYPKRFDFSTITQREVNATVRLMNHTKRKCLGWRTPCAVFGKCCTSG